MAYIVQTGDILQDIASKLGTTVEAIVALNPTITDPNKIFPGERILIPPREFFCFSAALREKLPS